MAMISRDVLREVNMKRNDKNNIYSFQCDNGQDFYILTKEQFELITSDLTRKARSK